MLKFASLIAIVLMTIVLCSDYSGNNMALANLKPVPDLTQLYLIADKLDKGLLDENVRKEPGFKQRVIDFVSLPKGEIVKDQLNKMNAVLDDFQKDANEFIKGYNPNSPFKFFDTNKNKAYSTAKQENGLTKLIDDYKERLDLKLGVTEADISCDLDVFQMTKLHDMLYVLQKDIMYLGAEKPSVIIRAIEDKLKETKYYAKHDQYNNYGATDEQKELMKNLYFSVVIADTKNTLDAVHHYEYPNPLVLGRISDDCSSLLEFAANYDRLNKERVEHCANSEMAKVPKRHPVIRVLKDDFANEMKFCEDYLAARAPAPSL